MRHLRGYVRRETLNVSTLINKLVIDAITCKINNCYCTVCLHVIFVSKLTLSFLESRGELSHDHDCQQHINQEGTEEA